MDASRSTTPIIHWQSISICFLTIIAALLFLAGLSSFFKLSSAQAAQPAAPTATDFAVGIFTDVVSLDPALAGWDPTSLVVVRQIYDTLTVYPIGGSLPQPSLALTWSVSADGITWTFQLREGVSFHDGTPLDAEAVVFNIERWWDPDNPYHDGNFEYFQAMFGGLKGDADCILVEVNAIGSDQVQLVLTDPHYELASFISMPSFSIASPAAIQAGTLPGHPVGSGAFRFVEHIPGASVVLEANPDYWDGAPKIETLSFRVIPDDAERFAALEANTIQAVGDLPDEYALLAADEPQLQVHWRASSWIGYLGMNSAHTPLGEPLVRQAIAHAIDLPALLEGYYTPGDQLAEQFLPPAVWGSDPDLSAYSYNPAESLSLLATAGYTDGFTTTLSYRPVWRPYQPDPGVVATAIYSYLQAVGIEATVIEYESGEFLEKWMNGELDLFLLGWGADYLHPDNFFTPILCGPGNLGFGPLDETLCTIVDSARAESDFAAQLAHYQAASRRVHENLPLLPIVNPRDTLLLCDNVAGVQAVPLGMESYAQVFLTGAEQIIVDPETETSLVYFDEQSLTTTLDLPVGAVSETVLLRFVVTDTTSVPEGYAGAKHDFELSAIDFGEVIPGFAFLEPVTLSIYYADADVGNLHEETLRLFYWDETGWLDAATTCEPDSEYVRDLEANFISLPICHLSTFGLFGEPQIRQFLPFVARK
jgi:peptide/nickel transport system substrate-binding protein